MCIIIKLIYFKKKLFFYFSLYLVLKLIIIYNSGYKIRISSTGSFRTPTGPGLKKIEKN
jgi:hypothetical protein